MFSPRRSDEIICELCGRYARDYDHIRHWCHKCCIKLAKEREKKEQDGIHKDSMK